MSHPRDPGSSPGPASPTLVPHHRIDIVVLPRPYVIEPLLEGIQPLAREQRWRLVLRYSWEPGLAQKLHSSPAAGFILLDEQPDLQAALRRIHRPKVAVRVAADEPGTPRIVQDDEAVGRIAAEHLLGQGFTRFAFYGVDFPYSEQRHRGFTSALVRAGHTSSSNLALDEPSASFPIYADALDDRNMLRWVMDLARPTAVMACSDEFGARLIDTCEDAGLRVPTDVAVVAADNNELRCEFSPVTMSSVDPNLRAAGRAAAEILLDALEGRPPRAGLVRTIQPRGVVKRRSTEWLSGSDPELDQALTMIRAEAHLGITIEDVLDRVPLSRTALEQRFRKQLGRPPGEELRRVRFEAAARLLRETELNVNEVAARAGYSSAGYLCQTFQKMAGLTPKAYRARHAGPA